MRFRTIAASFAALVVVAVGIPVGINAVQEDAADRRAAQREARSELRSAGGGRANRVSDHRETGLVRFLGTEHGRPIATKQDAPAAAARAFLDEFGAAFGVHDPAEQLRLDRAEIISTRRAMNGGAVVRFQQRVSDVPVIAGELAIRLDENNSVLSALGEILPVGGFDTDTAISAEDATKIARTSTAKRTDVRRAVLSASRPELWIYSPALIGAPDGRPTALVWRTTVTSTEPITKAQVLVDARTGNIALYVDELQHARDRRVCNNNNSAGAPFECTSPVRAEGGAASSVAEVNLAYDYTGHAYDFLLEHHDRDSIDGEGMPIKSIVKYCDVFMGCPMINAFWYGDHLRFGEGFVADDVVTHELMHGVIEKTAGLFYAYQSGAINESLADVWGEFVDLTNAAGTDTGGVRWLLGEDVNPAGTEFDGAVRDMKNPPVFGQPDRMRSALYYDEQEDNGGVHYNSGVNNKAAFLMTDGGSFNGQTLTGIDVAKAADVYYETLTNGLTSGSDYADLGDALQQACETLIEDEVTTPTDCVEVTKAVTATEMHLQPLSGGAPEAPLCDSGVMTNIYFDDVESGATGWASSPSSSWERGNVFAHSGKSSWLTATDPVDAAVALQMTTSRGPVPTGSETYLRFDHAHFFEHYEDGLNFDGGVVEYSTNNGSTWTDVDALPDVSVYNGVITDGTDNPLDGQPAFVGHSRGYISTRIKISSLAGQQVRFRFRYGADESVSDYGWAVDDVRIYSCAEPSQPTLSISNASISEGNSGTNALSFNVTKSGSTASTVTANYATSDGTATVADTDYVAGSGSVSFAPSETTKTVSVTINGDTKIESNETFNVTLSSPTNATIGTGTGVGTITNDDQARVITVGDATKEEGETVRFTLSATNPQMGDVTVNIATANGSAVAPGDYTARETTPVTIPGGTTTVPVDVLTTEDGAAEPTESFKLNLSGASANGSISTPQATGTITDDDARALSVSDITVTEGGSATFRVQATQPSRGDVSFDVETLTDTAGAADFTELPTTRKTIANGVDSIDVAVATTDDAVTEPNEFFKLKISNASENGVVDVAQAKATILDNDAPPVVREVSISDKNVSEGNDAVFTITATNPGAGSVTVDVDTRDGTAKHGDDDYEELATTVTLASNETTKNVTVETNEDDDEEEDETFFVDLSNVTGGVTGDDEGRGKILDDDADDDDDDHDPTPTPTVTPTPTTASDAKLEYSPSTLIGGKSATVTGSGFPANTVIDIYIHSEPMFLGSVRSTAGGTFTVVVDIPLLAAGSHTLVAQRASDDASLATVPATLAQIGTTTPAPAQAGTQGATQGATPAPTARVLAAEETPVPAGALPDTGGEIASMVMYALIAIALGISSVGAERWLRRRRTG